MYYFFELTCFYIDHSFQIFQVYLEKMLIDIFMLQKSFIFTT
jgi:hypothetical protein